MPPTTRLQYDMLHADETMLCHGLVGPWLGESPPWLPSGPSMPRKTAVVKAQIGVGGRERCRTSVRSLSDLRLLTKNARKWRIFGAWPTGIHSHIIPLHQLHSATQSVRTVRNWDRVHAGIRGGGGDRTRPHLANIPKYEEEAGEATRVTRLSTVLLVTSPDARLRLYQSSRRRAPSRSARCGRRRRRVARLAAAELGPPLLGSIGAVEA